MIVEQVLEAKQAKIKQWPVNSNRASELGHECLRYLVLNRTRWQEKVLHGARLQMIFDMGKWVEEAVYQDLREAGVVVVEQQRPFSWAAYQITGSIDCKLAVNGCVYPCEIKSAAPSAFDSIHSIEDMRRHKWAYMRRYPAQLTLYLLLDGKDQGLFLFKNKSTGELREIWMDMDYAFAETLIQKAEAINAHVAAGTLPEPMEYQESVCSECAYVHLCLPDRIGAEVQVINDERLLELVARHEELKPIANEYDRINAELKKLVEGQEKILLSDYFIQGKWIDRKGYAVPDSRYWKYQIMRVDGKEVPSDA